MLDRWLQDYVSKQCEVYTAIPLEQVARLVDLLRDAHRKGTQVFVFGNGGSAANASHFVTDVGKGSSDALGKRFRKSISSTTRIDSWSPRGCLGFRR